MTPICRYVFRKKIHHSGPACIDRFHCHAIKNKSKTIQWKKLRNCDVIEDKKNKTLLSVLALCVSPNFRYSSKCFAEIYRAQYKNAMLVYLHGTPIWRPENIVNVWNLLWLSRRLITSTEKSSIYTSTFPKALASNRAQNHEISIYFSTNLIVVLCHRTTITRKFKMLWFPNEARY